MDIHYYNHILFFFYCISLTLKERPDLILTNGPGTCVPIVFSAFLIRVLGIKKIKTVFSESFACVSHISLSGKILYYIVDRFFVQWSNLIQKYPRAQYIGRLEDDHSLHLGLQDYLPKSKEKRVFVTVGSTKFDDLIKAVDTQNFITVLEKAGYTSLHIQTGHGDYLPLNIIKFQSTLEVKHFKFIDSLSDEIVQASLVISHAGAGSILETLESRRPLIVVPNETLMNNHQTQLAETLAEKGYLFCAKLSSPKSLVLQIKSLDLMLLKPFPPESNKFFAFIEEEINS